MFYAIIVFVAMLYLSGARAFFHFHRLYSRNCYKIWWYSSVWFLLVPTMPSSLPKHKIWFSKLFWNSASAKRSMLLSAVSCYLFLNSCWELSTLVNVIISIVFGVIFGVFAAKKSEDVNKGNAEHTRYCRAVGSCINIVLHANESDDLGSAICEDLSLEASDEFISFPVIVVAFYAQNKMKR